MIVLVPTLNENIRPSANDWTDDKTLQGVGCAPYSRLHFWNTSGMDIFVNLPAAFPGGPGGKRCRREKRKSKKRAAITPARNMGVRIDVMLVLVILNIRYGESHFAVSICALLLR